MYTPTQKQSTRAKITRLDVFLAMLLGSLIWFYVEVSPLKRWGRDSFFLSLPALRTVLYTWFMELKRTEITCQLICPLHLIRLRGTSNLIIRQHFLFESCF
jgi:hypothetical protein